ncbi:MAG: ASPIC/UnbV domain-containing protein [Planctomycetaceae bacterium]
MTQPTDRECQLPQIGELDEEAGEFWSANPFMIVQEGENLSAFERNRIYMNVKGSKFVDGSFASMADIDSDSRIAVSTDIDGDGALDLLVGSAGGGPMRAFKNQLPQKNRVAIRFNGSDSNRTGVGVRVIAQAGGQEFVRDLFPSSGFMGIGPAELWVGVGDAEKIDRLTIRWPSGKTQELTDIDVNQRLEISEASDELRSLGSFTSTDK